MSTKRSGPACRGFSTTEGLGHPKKRDGHTVQVCADAEWNQEAKQDLLAGLFERLGPDTIPAA